MTETPNPYIPDTDTMTGEMHPIRRVVVGLGSNLGERLASLQGAVNALADTPDFFVTGVSPVYETEPVGGPEQPLFLNAILVIDTTLSARSLMERAQAAEAAFGRTRDIPNGPRTLDVDVLAVGELTSVDADLQVPHPRLAERAFVLVPWADVDPQFRVPGLGRVVDLSSAVDATGIRRTDDLLELPS